MATIECLVAEEDEGIIMVDFLYVLRQYFLP